MGNVAKLPNVQIEPITEQDIASMDTRSLKITTRGVAVRIDGKTACICGVVHTTPLQAYSVVTDEVYKHKRIYGKVIDRFKGVLSGYDGPIVAIASKDEKNPAAILSRAGFEYRGVSKDGDIWVWEK